MSSNVNIKKSSFYSFGNSWLGSGLLLSSGDHWQTHRKLLTPAFHFQILENFIPIINKQQKILLDIISLKCAQNKGIINDIRPLMVNCTLDTICETAMGVSINAQTESHSQYLSSVRKVCDSVVNRFLAPWVWSDIAFSVTRDGIRFKKYVHGLHLFTNSVIKERKSEFMNKLNESESFDDAINTFGRKKKLAFLDCLLTHHLKFPDQLSELDIREEVDTFMFEGHDTTASAILFSLFLIGHHQNIQSKIHEELDSIFYNDQSRPLTIDDLREMKYLEQCIKESVRLYPSVPYIGRENSEEFTAGDYHVPMGSQCLVLIYALHRDPNVFPNPEVFDPERFSPQNCIDRHPFAYLPFSAGPRNCIGQKFAILELKALLSSILRKFTIITLTQTNDVILSIEIILGSKTPIKMQYTAR